MSSAKDLLAEAKALYVFDEEQRVSIEQLEDRLNGPLRIALVGSVKAGKSTLLNGLLGERVAPTDARECTRIVTEYRYGATPKVQGLSVDGETRSIFAGRQPGRLELDLAGVTPDQVHRLDVAWPSQGISDFNLVDTPGTASLTREAAEHTEQFLFPEEGPSGADAVIYLLRSLHDNDVRYLRSLRDHTNYGESAIGAIAVLSRADEIGAGRLDAQLAINETAHRLRKAADLEDVCETVVPVAGLLGLGATTMKQSDVSIFVSLAALPQETTQSLLLTAERFISVRNPELPNEQARHDLVDRYGMYGIRLAIAAVRGGLTDAEGLSAELLRRSGLLELRRVIEVHFTQRKEELQAHSVVFALHKLLRQHPRKGSEELLVAADQHMSSSHSQAEMALIGKLAAGRVELSHEQLEELSRLVGGSGTSPMVRLGLGSAWEKSGDETTLRDSAIEHLVRWRDLRDNPLLERDTAEACAIAERSCEQIIASLEPSTVDS